jgi:hypothetical protein
MNIVRCPRCMDDVTVPLRASPKALVRCPLCLEEYLLSEALDGLPPALVVLDGSEMADEPALAGAGVARAEAGRAEYGGGDEYRLTGGAFDAALDASGPGAAVGAPRPVVKGAARPKKKEKSALVELVKIVLGGLVGLTLGYFALLWGFGMDVLDLGPKITPYAPWIVPAKFQGKPAEGSTASTSGAAGMDTSGDSTPQRNDNGNGNGKRRKNGEQKPMESIGGGVAPSSATKPDVPADPPANEGGPGGIAVEPDLKPIPLPEPDLGPLLPEVNPKPAKPEPTEKPEPKPVEKPAPKPEPEPEAKPLPTADDLTKGVLAAVEGYTKVSESAGQPPEIRKQLYTEMYLAASDVGRIVSQLDASSADLTEQIDTLKTFLNGIAVQPGKVSALKSLTDINLPQRKHDEGVLVAGVVQDFASAGSLFACKFQAGKSLTETTIVSATNPQVAYKAGDELLVIGRVVDDPMKNLPGYEGDAERVVLLGYGVIVPKAEPTPNP